MINKAVLFFLLLSVLACGSSSDCEDAVDISNVDLDLQFENLTHKIHELNSKQGLMEFLEENPAIKNTFFGFNDLLPEGVFHSQVLRLATTPKAKPLYNSPNYQSFSDYLEKNRDLRELLVFPYLSEENAKSQEDLFRLMKSSSILGITDIERIGLYLDDHPEEKELYARAFGYVTPEQMLDQNVETLQNPYVDTLYQETLSLIDVGQVEYDLEQAYKRLKSFYPEFESPKVEAIYSGFGSDLYISDSLLIIGLDYYLGEQASFRPNVYEYIKSRLTPAHLVPQLLQFTSLKYNETSENDADRTLLDEMIYYGKALEFAQQMLPCVADSIIMGYTPKQMADSEVSETVIWNHFLEEQLIYSEDPMNITKYIDERPAVPEIDKICPGRIGQWIGWQIVKAYRKETGVGFVELMKETDTQRILTRSKYRPRLR